MAPTAIQGTESQCRCLPGCADGCSIRPFLPDQLLSPVRLIQRYIVDSPSQNTKGGTKLLSPGRLIELGIVHSPSMNTRGAQKRKGSEQFGQEVADADAAITEVSEEVMIGYSRKIMKKLTDNELLVAIIDHIDSHVLSCGNTDCDCLDILTDVNVRECVAKYLVQFERKNKYDQDSIILEWYKYAIAARTGRRHMWYHLPYDATWTDDIDCIRVSQAHTLCTRGMCSLLGIGKCRFTSIRGAAFGGVMPHHKGAGRKSNITIKHDDPRIIHLRNHSNICINLVRSEPLG